MKKTLLFLSTFLLMLNPVVANASGWAVGVSISDNTLDTAGKEDVDSNGSIDATKNVSDNFAVGSIFVEYSNINDKYGVTFGVDYIPFDADIDKRSIAQSSVGADPGTVTTGNNSVEGTVKDHYTIYVQPGYMVSPSTMLYGTLGLATATVNGKSVSLSHTNINKDVNMDGTKVGVGVKHTYDSGLFIKADYSETSYDTISFTTSNSTKATADLDNTSFGISIGKQF